MDTVISKDGTPIAYERVGLGLALVFVMGAFNDHSTGEPLARSLSLNFNVYNYDRRGRGESGDTLPYAIEREIEDLDAVIARAGGSAAVFGYSSGAILALRAAAYGLPITRLALYEPPPPGDRAGEIASRLAELIAAGRRGDAVELFQTDAVGIPAEVVTQMRSSPFRPALEAMAHTLVYEMTILEPLSPGLADSVRIPTLVIDGENSPDFLRQANQSLAAALPAGRSLTLPDQTHDLVPEALAPVLEEFLLG